MTWDSRSRAQNAQLETRARVLHLHLADQVQTIHADAVAGRILLTAPRGYTALRGIGELIPD